MVEKQDILLDLISRFGISQQSAEVFLALHRIGQVGIMDLCKEVGLGRNVVYRLLDELEGHQLVSVANRSFGKTYSARGVEAFEALVASREASNRQLKLSLHEVAEQLNAVSGGGRQSIIHYSGKDGLKQVNWNLTKADKEYRVYEQSHVHEYLDSSFSHNMRVRYVERNLTSFDLTNRTVIEPYFNDIDPEYWRKKANYRYIDPKVLDIQHEMFIYNDVVTLLDYAQSKSEAVEVHNQRLATMQRQIFDALWQQAQELVVDPSTYRRQLKS